MADETFEIGFQVSGEGDAAKAFEDLKVQQLQAQQASSALSAELRKLQQSGAATDQELENAARALVRAREAAAQYGREAQQVARSQAAVTQATRVQSQAAAQQATSVTQLGQRWGQVGTALGQVSGVVAQVTPQFGTLGQILGQVGGATGALSGAMGPFGVAIGVATAAVGALALVLESSGDEAHTLTDELKAALPTLDDFIGKLHQANEIRAQQSRIGMGLGGAEEQQAALAQAERRAGLARTAEQRRAEDIESRRRHGQGIFATEEEDLARLHHATQAADQELRRLHALERQRSEEEVQDLEEELQAAADEDLRREQARNRHHAQSHHDDVAGRLQREEEFYQHLQELREQDIHRELEAREHAARDQAARIAELYAFWRDLDRENTDAIVENQHVATNKLIEELDRKKAARQEEADAAKQQQLDSAQITSDMWGSMGDTVTDAAGAMFKFIVSSADKSSEAFLRMLDGFLEATAIQYGIEALAEGAQAAMAFARYDYPAGAQHLIAAGLAIGVAAATGIGAAAINVPSAPSGGGASAQPVSGAAGTAGGGSVQNITVQLFAPQAVFTEGERADLIAHGFREARRQRGPAAAGMG